MDHAAILETLCARGPWTVREPGLDKPPTLTGDDVRACYIAIRDGGDIARAVGAVSGSDRRVDRALRLLRAAGLIEYAGTPKRWRVTS